VPPIITRSSVSLGEGLREAGKDRRAGDTTAAGTADNTSIVQCNEFVVAERATERELTIERKS